MRVREGLHLRLTSPTLQALCRRVHPFQWPPKWWSPQSVAHAQTVPLSAISTCLSYGNLHFTASTMELITSSLRVPPSTFSMNSAYTKHLRMARIPPFSSLAVKTTNPMWMWLVTPGYRFILHLSSPVSFSGLWLFPSVFFVPVSQLVSLSSLAPLCITAGMTLRKHKSNQI